MKLPQVIKKLCTPAFLYFSISMIAIILMIFQNYGNENKYCLGDYNCHTENLSLIFLGKILYVIFWTFILNLICKAGFTGISWFLVLFPFIFMFVILGIMILQGEPIIEGMEHMDLPDDPYLMNEDSLQEGFEENDNIDQFSPGIMDPPVPNA